MRSLFKPTVSLFDGLWMVALALLIGYTTFNWFVDVVFAVSVIVLMSAISSRIETFFGKDVTDELNREDRG